jgi:uncharacterized protein (TIGR02246 family)
MRTSLQVVGMGLTVAFTVLSFSPIAAAELKDEVEATAVAWGQALGEDDPDKVLPLYSSDAVLWGTLSPKLRSDPAALRDYFVNAFKVLSSLKVTFGDHLIRVYGNTAINTGYYTFSYAENGESKTFPARYSFTYVKNGDRWMIVDHHSSAMPTPPK